MAESVETAIYKLRIEGEDQIKRLTESIEGLAIAEEDATKATRKTSEELQKKLARYDPLLRAQQQYTNALEDVARYQESGVGTQREIDALLQGATARYQAAKQAVSGLDEAHKGLTASGQAAFHSLRSMFEQIALGQSPIQAMIGQMNHLSFAASGEGGVTGAFKQVGSIIAGFLSPVNLAIGAVVGLTAVVVTLASRWAEARQQMERGLIGAGRDTSLADLKQFQSANATGGGLSISEARAGGIGLAKTGQIDINQLKGYEDAVRGFSILTGKDIPESMAAMQKALTGGAAGVDELNKTYMVFDATARKNIATLAQSTDQTRAANAMIDAMAEANRKATTTVSAFEEAWTTLKNLFANFGQTTVQTKEEIIALKEAQLGYLESLKNGFFGFLFLDAAAQTAKLREELAKLKAQTGDTSAGMKQLSIDADNYTRSLIPQIAQLEKVQQELKALKEAQAAGQGGPDTATAILIAEGQKRSLEDAKAELILQARMNAPSSAAGTPNRDETVLWREAPEKLKKVADETERAREEADRLKEAAKKVDDAYRSAVFSAQAIADATDIAAENTARAAKTAADFARAMRSAFEPVTMPAGALTFQPNDLYPVSYRGGGTGTRIGPSGDPNAVRANAGIYYTVDPITGARVAPAAATAATKLTDSLDKLTTSTDDLRKSNEDLLSPYYNQDPRTSHIGFRSQGMAAGGYIDVPGGISSNDNMIATVPVASGERIYIDPMNNRRGTTQGSGTVINISSPINIFGNADKDQFGRTVYQANQQLAKSVRAATQ